MTSTSWLNSILSKISLLAVCSSLIAAIGCGDYGLDRYHPLPSSTYTMSTADLVVETPSTAEVGGGLFKLTASGTADYGCSYDTTVSSTTGNSPGLQDTLTSTTHRQAAILAVPSAITVTGLKARLRRSGGPSGNMFLELMGSDGTIPSATLLATSGSTSISNAGIGATGTLLTFTMSSNIDVANGSNLSVVLNPDSAASINAFNKFGFVTTNDGTGAACNQYPVYKVSLDSGSNWIDSNNATAHRVYYYLTLATYNPSGTGYWTVTAEKSVSWNMSSFEVSEKPNSMGGTITYDIGAAEDSTPTYSQTGLTKAQVQALTGIAGKYLFVRVNLGTATPYYERAEVGDASISNY